MTDLDKIDLDKFYYHSFNPHAEFHAKKLKLEPDKKGRGKRSRWTRNNNYKYLPTSTVFKEQIDEDLTEIMHSYLPESNRTVQQNSAKKMQWKDMDIIDENGECLTAYVYKIEKYSRFYILAHSSVSLASESQVVKPTV